MVRASSSPVGTCHAPSYSEVLLTREGLSSVARSANYAVGTFVLAASGMFYWCDRRRKEEAHGMALAVAGMKMLNEKRARERAAEEAAAAAKTAEEEKARKAKSWYKVW